MFWVAKDRDEHLKQLLPHELLAFPCLQRERHRNIRNELEKLESRLFQLLLYSAKTRQETKKHNVV